MNRIFCEKRESDFVMVYREPFRNPQMSLKARGLLATIYSFPDNWDFTVKGICSVIRESRDCVLGAIKELKELGYCRTEETRNEQGKILGTDYFFAEYPKFLNTDTSNPQTENPYTEKPYTENPYQYNKTNNIVNNESIKEDKEEITEGKHHEKPQSHKEFADEQLDEAWNTLLQEKKWKCKSPHSLDLSIRKLKNMTKDEALCAIEITIERGYQGIFPPKPYELSEWKNTRKGENKTSSIDELLNQHYGKK